jgi:hypothetical protein
VTERALTSFQLILQSLITNVATAFRQVLTKPLGIHPQSLAQALQSLEGSALQNMQDFGSQQIANTLHIMAKQRYKTTGSLLLAMERRSEAISGQFNSQDISNTLWAFATMGTRPGEQMMGQLERRAEAISGEFNSQEVANTLWSICFFACFARIWKAVSLLLGFGCFAF